MALRTLVVAESPWEMPLDSDEEMKRAVLDRCQTAFHPVETARLSKSIDQGVIDPSLKVYGARNLRLIDASVMPLIPDCRIQNAVCMVAEKGADMIEAEHKDIYLFTSQGYVPETGSPHEWLRGRLTAVSGIGASRERLNCKWRHCKCMVNYCRGCRLLLIIHTQGIYARTFSLCPVLYMIKAPLLLKVLMCIF